MPSFLVAALLLPLGALAGALADHAWPLLSRLETSAPAASAGWRRCCRACNRPLPLWPGRCRGCGQVRGRSSRLLALCGALAFAVTGWRFGATAATGAGVLLAWMLLTLAAIDLECGLLPDRLTLPLLWAGLLYNLLSAAVPLDRAVLGAVAGYLLLWLLYWVFRLLTGREGLGYGDFKLLAAIGAWLGWTALPTVLLWSSLTGLLAGGMLMLARRMTRADPLPFGPFLAAAGWMAWLAGTTI